MHLPLPPRMPGPSPTPSSRPSYSLHLTGSIDCSLASWKPWVLKLHMILPLREISAQGPAELSLSREWGWGQPPEPTERTLLKECPQSRQVGLSGTAVLQSNLWAPEISPWGGPIYVPVPPAVLPHLIDQTRPGENVLRSSVKRAEGFWAHPSCNLGPIQQGPYQFPKPCWLAVFFLPLLSSHPD